jgi:hypothetical protein
MQGSYALGSMRLAAISLGKSTFPKIAADVGLEVTLTQRRIGRFRPTGFFAA